MKKMRMCFPKEKTFADGFAEYVLVCKARNLREGTIHHYEESIKQIYKRIPPDTPISSMNRHTMEVFYIALRADPDINEITMGTYARDLKTLMRFFMKCQYILSFEIPLSFVICVLLLVTLLIGCGKKEITEIFSKWRKSLLKLMKL